MYFLKHKFNCYFVPFHPQVTKKRWWHYSLDESSLA